LDDLNPWLFISLPELMAWIKLLLTYLISIYLLFTLYRKAYTSANDNTIVTRF
jgi:hypothetical protein